MTLKNKTKKAYSMLPKGIKKRVAELQRISTQQVNFILREKTDHDDMFFERLLINVKKASKEYKEEVQGNDKKIQSI